MFDTIIPAAQFDRGKPIKMKLSADQEACSALAERFSWIEVCSVETSLVIRKIADGAYLVSGQIEAAIIQRCRLSDNPVPDQSLSMSKNASPILKPSMKQGRLIPWR